MRNPVARDGDEWNVLEFALQLRCRTSRVNLLQAWNITKPDAISVFSRWAQTAPIVEAFINAETLDRNNSVQDVCTRGMDIGSNGFKVSIGNIKCSTLPLTRSTLRDAQQAETQSGALDNQGKILPPKNATTTNMMYGDKRIYEYFVCDVALGKSISVADEVEAQRVRLSMPVEYDSVYIESSENNNFLDVTLVPRGSDDTLSVEHLQDDVFPQGVLPQYAFRKDYIVYGASQILPKYLIQFECDPSAEETFALPLCDSCQNDAATLYCASDTAKICKKCDEKLHSHKVVSRHIRVPLNKMPRPVAKCRLHPSKVYTMYCTVCHLPVCQLCTSGHIHGQGSQGSGSTRFIPIANAYDSAIYEMQQHSSETVTRRKEYLNKLLEQLKSIEKTVEDNCERVEVSCYENLEASLNDLHTSIQSSVEIIVAEQTENQRHLNQLKWAEHFAAYLKNTLLPADYLRAWLRHCRFRAEVSSTACKEPLQEVFPNIDLKGELSIMHEQSVDHAYH
ncbi:B-box zinc finger family protein [Babesia bovis T2Bo]|uniref:Zinc finger (B box) protein, putative n=1 Tax=Babesia bovis TaxID=5865 RepID=A7ATL5_BABBO|nr:B-box zinc finger family protein [Babesia bovis T2Bo]EDO06276.1 B-box zinc finger family protein [Babesia bovis T2Bo]|eukprot:XP_001609844.1 zinc finger (B box) protein [Babesia bovis T2Bo]